MRLRRGITIIELLTTLGLIVLVAGIVSGVFIRSTLSSTTLHAASRDLATNLRYAAELATTTQNNHAIRFNISNSSYEIIRLTTPEVIIKNIALPSSITFSSVTFPDNTVVFNVLGAVTQAGSITLQHNASQTATIEVRPSGYVRIP